MHFAIFYTYDAPTFKTKVLRLARNEGRVKRFLQLYKRLITLVFFQLFGYNLRRILLLGPCLSITSTARAIKRIRKTATIIQPIILSQNHATSYLWPQGHMHMHARTHIHLCIEVVQQTSKRTSKANCSYND